MRWTIDPARTIANISAERDRLPRVYSDLSASRKKTLVDPRWPHVEPRWPHVVDGIDPHDPPAVEGADTTVAVALGIARAFDVLASA